MARQSQWLTKLPEAQAALAALPWDYEVDRETLETLFSLPSRTALRVLKELGGTPDPSGRLVLPAGTLLSALERAELVEQAEALAERQRGREELLQIKGRFAGPDKPDPPFPRAELRAEWRREDLPAAIQLAPGRCVIEFADVRDLLWQLEQLVAVLGDNYPAAEAWLDPARHAGAGAE